MCHVEDNKIRVGINGRIMTQVSGTVPLRVQMLRDALFAPIFMSSSGATIRTAAEQWNNRPVTCVLISGSTDTTPGRHWEETEHCIDNASGLLMIESRAPGVFSIYSYNKGLQFHGRSVPDQITIYQGPHERLSSNPEQLEEMVAEMVDADLARHKARLRQ